MIIAISACMAGAVCGDHCSPISDTTIMASAGAQCNHVNHVSTQLPYAIIVAAVSCVTYIVAGFVQTPVISLPIGILLMIAVLVVMKNSKREASMTPGEQLSSWPQLPQMPVSQKLKSAPDWSKTAL